MRSSLLNVKDMQTSLANTVLLTEPRPQLYGLRAEQLLCMFGHEAARTTTRRSGGEDLFECQVEVTQAVQHHT